MLELFDIIEDYINQIIVPLNWLMLFLIIGGGIYLTLISRANPLRKISQGFKLLLKKDNSAVGISRFQALSAVLAATVGLGNISGVSLQFIKEVQVFLFGCGLLLLLALQ